MFNPETAPVSTYMPSFETAARSLKVVPIIAPVHGDDEIETATITLAREPGGGLVVMPDAFMTVHRAPIILAAARNNVPAVYNTSAYVREGGLLSYGPRSGRPRSSCRHLCGSHAARREAGRSPGAAADKIRDGPEPQDRHGANLLDREGAHSLQPRWFLPMAHVIVKAHSNRCIKSRNPTKCGALALETADDCNQRTSLPGGVTIK